MLYLVSVACNLLLPTSHMEYVIVNAHTCPTGQDALQLLNRESEVADLLT